MTIDRSSIMAKKNETLEDHIARTVRVAKYVLQHLSDALKNVSSQLDDVFYLGNPQSTEESCNEIKDFILELVQFHDDGKVNPRFREALGGKDWDKTVRQHAIYSFYSWYIHCLNTRKVNPYRTAVAYAVIAGHHGGLKNPSQGLGLECRVAIEHGLDLMKEWGSICESEHNDAMDDLLEWEDASYSSVFLTFQKIAFSVLVLSDSISSSSLREDEFKEVVEHLIASDIKNVDFGERFKTSPIMNQVDQSTHPVSDGFEKCQKLNDVRSLVNKKAVHAYEQGKDIYILEAPVGVGKTFSALALANILIEKERMRKIVSVFPLNSVQTQYVETLQQSINLDDVHMGVVNHESLFGIDNAEERPFSSTITPQNQWMFERQCFSKPLVVTSHVHFFHVVGSLKRRSALAFLSLRNSVVIIDEFQNYPESFWMGIWTELLLLSKWLGVKWIFTSGTFPVDMKQLTAQFGQHVKAVFSDHDRDTLFSHPSIQNRYAVTHLHDSTAYDDLGRVCSDIIQRVHLEEENGHTQFIVCVGYVDHAKRIYQEIRGVPNGYQVYFLCGRHSPSYKRALLKCITEHNQRRSDKVILVSTKTVECGMDFDFDVGFKEFDKFDSVEQLAGRVNRSNARKQACVYTFRLSPMIRKPMGNEKLYEYDERLIDDINQKKFSDLYEKLYRDNKLNMRECAKNVKSLHTTSAFKEYGEFLTVIKGDHFTESFFLVKTEEEELFLDAIRNHPKSTDFATAMIQSRILQTRLEPYLMTATVKWLQKMDGHWLIPKEEEKSGIFYRLIANDGRFDEYIETYTAGGLTSYLERGIREVEKYEFY